MTEADFLKCCGSRNWAMLMTAYRGEDAIAEAGKIWWSLDREDWLEAFRSHPKIGEKANSDLSEREQAAARGAASDILSELRDLNSAYERRFGYIFIVCATGKSAAEMLAILKGRMNNDPETELREAAAQQLQITQLRLENLLRA